MRTLMSSFRLKTARVAVMAALAIITVSCATAQTTTGAAEVDPVLGKSNMLIINPLKFLFAFYNVSYYHRLSNSMVLGGGIQVPSLKGFSGFGAQAELRFHLAGKAMKGFYIAPNVSFNKLTYKPDDLFSGLGVSGLGESKATVFSVGALVGWQWFIGDDFPIGLGIGYDYYSASAEDETEVGSFSDYDGGSPAFRFDIGYAF